MLIPSKNRNRILFELLLVNYIFVCVKSDYNENMDKPLFLTPYIEIGLINEAKERAAVKHPQIKNTESYAGYLTINKLYNSNTFFWYFPSKDNPENDPLLVWLNGGPGSTSLFGLFVENGPFIITKNGTVEMRQYSWHANHNIIYIDNPVGTGYSFTNSHLGYVRLQEDAGRDILTALIQFFKIFPERRKNDFYVCGESYGGKYAPALSHAIKIYNEQAESKINLKGFAIGNGITDPINQISYHSDFLFGIGLLDSRQKDEMSKREETIRTFIGQEKYIEATLVLDEIILRFYTSGPSLFKNMTGLDYYCNYLEMKEPEEFSRYLSWIIKPDVRRAIHVGDSKFTPSSSTVKEYLKEDLTRSAAHFVADLLEDYKVLIYHGQTDIAINYVGTIKFIENLTWTGVEDFKLAEKKQWRVGSDLAGYSKTAKNLNFVLVRNGAHYLPYDQPLWAWDMITRFTHNVRF